MSNFVFHRTSLEGVLVAQRLQHTDSRGFFSRLYCEFDYRAAGLHKPVVQINHSLTRCAGTVRGLHFQYPPSIETKVVNCLRGEIFDVVVDIRRGSPTFLRWHGEVLSSGNCRSLLIPEGFAHGFQALSDGCELVYLHTAMYHREAEGALNFADPSIAITWPLPVSEVSERDRQHPYVGNDFKGIDI